jgi:branched-chain amino acid transport system ATP-binding protein
MTVLKIEDIHTYYGESYILQGISIEVSEGQVVGILGRNGMGKTTLMRSIMGFTPPRRGRIRYGNVELTGKRSFEISKMGVSLVPQGRQIFPSLSVEENLTVVYRPKSDGWSLERIYELFPPLKSRLHHPGNHLSGGEQQMLAVGRSLMTNPSLLLMDEPTEGLSPLYVQTVGQIIRRLQKSGIAILLVEQNLSFTLQHTDYIHVLNRGMIVHSSTPEELSENKEVRTRFLGV